ncbi:hypothetical protein D3C75_1089360 [compost metagenome]
MQIHRVAAPGNTIFEAPPRHHILNAQTVTAVDAAGFPDADLCAHGGDGGFGETGDMLLQKFRHHKHLPASFVLRLGQFLHVGGVQPLHPGAVDQYLILRRACKEQHLVPVNGHLACFPFGIEA